MVDQRRCKKKKLLVLFMMLLGDDEYEHVERRCWSRQWVSRREERGAYYTIFKELAIEDSGLNFSHSLYDFDPTGLYFLYKTRLPFYLLLHSILKRKKLRIAQVVYFGPHVRSPFLMVF